MQGSRIENRESRAMALNVSTTSLRFNLWRSTSRRNQFGAWVLFLALIGYGVIRTTEIHPIEGMHKKSTNATATNAKNATNELYSNIETIALIATSFEKGAVVMCKELIKRANGTKEGQEPWRSSGGLLWNHSHCGEEGVIFLGNHLARW